MMTMHVGRYTPFGSKILTARTRAASYAAIAALLAALPAAAQGSGAPPATPNFQAPVPPAFTEAALLALPPLGPYCRVSAQKPAAKAKTRLAAPPPQVAALYQYNYDQATGAGFRYDSGGDALTQHPAQTKGYSYKSVAWHTRELSAMQGAGIDIALCNYWGNPADRILKPGQGLRWSFDGLKPLAEAAAQMNKTKRPAPKIGLYLSVGSFLDNAAHYNPDLGTNDGRAWLYVSLRDFYSLVPPNLRATGPKGEPLVFVPYVPFVQNGAGSDALWQYIRAHFVADFGVEPYLMVQDGWVGGDKPKVGGVINGTFPQVATPLEGLRETGEVASLGPGIDLRDGQKVFRDREKGAFYIKQWQTLLAQSAARRPRLVLLESWNQWGQATAIAPSWEYGNQYVLLTRKWADLFHSGIRKPLPKTGPYASTDRVSWFAATTDTEAVSGLRLVTPSDGIFDSFKTAVGGAYIEASDASVGIMRHLYFDVNDSFLFDANDAPSGSAPLRLTFEYWDEGRDLLRVQYDATETGEALRSGDDKGYALATEFRCTNTRTWKTATVTLPYPRFAGRENGGADFRFQTSKPAPLRLRWVTLRRGDGPL